MCRQTLLPPQVLENISVTFCFICVLHLCNEKNLSLVRVDKEKDKDKESEMNTHALPLASSFGDFAVVENKPQQQQAHAQGQGQGRSSSLAGAMGKLSVGGEEAAAVAVAASPAH